MRSKEFERLRALSVYPVNSKLRFTNGTKLYVVGFVPRQVGGFPEDGSFILSPFPNPVPSSTNIMVNRHLLTIDRDELAEYVEEIEYPHHTWLEQDKFAPVVGGAEDVDSWYQYHMSKKDSASIWRTAFNLLKAIRRSHQEIGNDCIITCNWDDLKNGVVQYTVVAERRTGSVREVRTRIQHPRVLHWKRDQE